MESTEDTTQHSALSEGDNSESPTQQRPSRTRQRGPRAFATVYDAVAGRVTYDKVLRDEGPEQKKLLETGVDQQSSARDSYVLAPEEVLFRRKDAPERYEEHDIYRANTRELPNGGGGGVLPGSDLLKAIHEYSSEFYGALNRGQPQFKGGRNVDELSMDETALLAFGILLEEAGREVLGRRGHLVFTEGIDDDEDSRGEEMAHDARSVGHQAVRSRQSGPKRRKI